MIPVPTPLSDFPEELREYNRERFKSHIAQGIYDLMQRHDVSRSRLASLLGVQKSRITELLSGCQNLEAASIADVYLIFGRTPYLRLGLNPKEIRLPEDEGARQETVVTGPGTTIALSEDEPPQNYKFPTFKPASKTYTVRSPQMAEG